MIQPYQRGEGWILVRNLRSVEDRRNTGSRSRGAPITVFDDCWATDRRWASTASFAKVFGSREEAQAYLDENQGCMAD